MWKMSRLQTSPLKNVGNPMYARGNITQEQFFHYTNLQQKKSARKWQYCAKRYDAILKAIEEEV